MPRYPEQLAHEIRDQAANLLTQMVDVPEGTIVTVTRAEVATDTRTATVYLAVLPDDRGPAILGLLRTQLYDLQGALYERLDRHPAPRIRFALEPLFPPRAAL